MHSNDWTLTVLRLALGIMILPHGAQKLFAFNQTMELMTSQGGLPWIIAFLVIIGEFFGGLALIIGFLTRFSAASIGFIMFVAAVMVHRPYGFFMNWTGQQKGEGIEFFLLAVAIAIAVTARGAGAWAVDGWLARFRAARPAFARAAR